MGPGGFGGLGPGGSGGRGVGGPGGIVGSEIEGKKKKNKQTKKIIVKQLYCANIIYVYIYYTPLW